MRRTRVALTGLTVLAVILLAGCSSVGTTGSAGAPHATVPSPTPTAAGDYPAGARLVLSNGASLAVPAKWRAELYTAGALISAPPLNSGVLGGMMDVPSVPHWGAVTFSVYGPKAGFADDRARLEQAYRNSLGADPATAHVTVSRTYLSLSGGQVTGAAYVTTYPTKPPRYEFEFFMQRPGAAPIVVASSLSTLPAGFEKATAGQMPQLFLDYLGFKWQ
jgi:hypothetical protein